MDICQFNKFGHCKFQGTCRKKHIMNICEKEECKVHNCLERHPRECSYYRDLKRCKFGSYCSYKHKNSKDDEIEEIKKDLNNVKSRLEQIEEFLKLIWNNRHDNQVKDTTIGEKNKKKRISKNSFLI